MKVKVLQKGFCGKQLREEGTVFNWPGEKCPPWCKSLEEKPVQIPTISTDGNVRQATEVISGLETVEAVKAFVGEDVRKGVTDAATARIAKLSE